MRQRIVLALGLTLLAIVAVPLAECSWALPD